MKSFNSGKPIDRAGTVITVPNVAGGRPTGQVVRIEVDKPSYGIHGTSHPENIGKTGSHGCVRLTNWDAVDLAGRVRKGVPVAFLDDGQTASGR